MHVPNKIKSLIHDLIYGEVASGFFGIFQGRSTFFAICFSITGVYGWLVLNRDLTSFALFAGAIQALLFAKSVSDDYHERQIQNTTVVNNISIPSSDPTKPQI